MRKVFKDDTLQKRFDKEGYVVVDFFSREDISELENIYYNHKVDDQPGLELSVWNRNYEVNKAICDLSGEILNERAKDVLIDYAPLYSGFATKLPRKPGVSQLHQDPTFVDEEQYRAITIWSPLVEVNEQNGALHVVKSSQRMFRGFRGFTVFEYNYSAIMQDVVERFSTIVEMKLGQAVIFDPALFHHSFDNKTDTIRIACTALMIPNGVKAIHYHHNKKLNSLDVYEIDNEFLLRYFNKYLGAEELDRPLVKRLPFAEPVTISLPEFEEKYHSVNKPQFSNKINAIFKKVFPFFF